MGLRRLPTADKALGPLGTPKPSAGGCQGPAGTMETGFEKKTRSGLPPRQPFLAWALCRAEPPTFPKGPMRVSRADPGLPCLLAPCGHNSQVQLRARGAAQEDGF